MYKAIICYINRPEPKIDFAFFGGVFARHTLASTSLKPSVIDLIKAVCVVMSL